MKNDESRQVNDQDAKQKKGVSPEGELRAGQEQPSSEEVPCGQLHSWRHCLES